MVIGIVKRKKSQILKLSHSKSMEKNTMSKSNKRTREILNNYLEEGKILIAVDSNVEGVVLPSHLMNSIQVKLNLSHSFKTSIFTIDDEKVEVDLAFQGVRTLCRLPLESIYYVAMASDALNGVEIVENMPIELLELSYELSMHEEREIELKEKQIDFMSEIPKGKASEIESRLNISPQAKKIQTARQKAKQAKSFARKNVEEITIEIDVADEIDFMSLIPKDKASEIETRMGAELTPKIDDNTQATTKVQTSTKVRKIKRLPSEKPKFKALENQFFDELMEMLSDSRLQNAFNNVSSLLHTSENHPSKKIGESIETKLDNEIDLSDFLNPKK